MVFFNILFLTRAQPIPLAGGRARLAAAYQLAAHTFGHPWPKSMHGAKRAGTSSVEHAPDRSISHFVVLFRHKHQLFMVASRGVGKLYS